MHEEPKKRGLAFYALGEGSISMMGDLVRNDRNLTFAGDVRLGGSWTVTNLVAHYKYTATASRTSRLTVMPGARLEVTEQDGDVNEKAPGALAVAKGGAVSINGTKLHFASNNTHYVDGALTVQCPLVAEGRQMFRGDGSLMLTGGIGDGSVGGVRFEGGLTLVPDGVWSANAPLSVKDNVMLAPTGDWTMASPMTVDIHSKLTVSAAGKRVTFGQALTGNGEVAVTGGRLVLGAAGSKLWKVTCANGAVIDVADSVFDGASGFVDVLSVRRDDPSVAFANNLRVTKRYDLATDSYVYSAKPKRGLVLIIR